MGPSKAVRSSSLQDLQDCSLENENEVNLEAHVDSEGTTWADNEANLTTDLNAVNTEANRTTGSVGTNASESQLSSSSSGKMWAELVAAERAKFTSNGTSACVSATDSSNGMSTQVGPSEVVQHKAEVPPVS